jgi:hypothetical protein
MIHIRCYAKGSELAAYRALESLEPERIFDVSILVTEASSTVEKYNEKTIDGSSRCQLLRFGEDGVVLRYDDKSRGSGEWTHALTLLVPWHAVLAVEIVPTADTPAMWQG